MSTTTIVDLGTISSVATGPAVPIPADASARGGALQIYSNAVTVGATIVVQARSRGPLGQGASEWVTIWEKLMTNDNAKCLPFSSLPLSAAPTEIRTLSDDWTDGDHEVTLTYNGA